MPEISTHQCFFIRVFSWEIAYFLRILTWKCFFFFLNIFFLPEWFVVLSFFIIDMSSSFNIEVTLDIEIKSD